MVKVLDCPIYYYSLQSIECGLAFVCPLQYCLKLSSNSENPAHKGVFTTKFKSFFDRQPNQIPPLGIVQPDLEATTYKCWIRFKTMPFVYALEHTAHLQHPVYLF